MTTHLRNLIDLDNAPREIMLEHNGVKTQLFYDATGDEICWVGYPVNSKGEKYWFGLRVYGDLTIVGSVALDYIARGGLPKKKGDDPLPRKTRNSNRDTVKALFLTAALLHKLEEHKGTLPTYLKENTGLEVEEGEMSETDVVTYALLGKSATCLRLARANGYRFLVDVPRYIRRFVSASYADIIEGEWDAESDEVVDTSSLHQTGVTLMQLLGHKFRLVHTIRKREAK